MRSISALSKTYKQHWQSRMHNNQTQYKVLSANSATELRSIVEYHLQAGWKLSGGVEVVVVDANYSLMFYQAVYL